MADKVVVLVEHDIWDVLEKQVKPEFIQAKSWKLRFNLFVSESIYKKLDDDPLLLQQVTDVASTNYKQILSEMRVLLTQAEKDARADSSEDNIDDLIGQLEAQFKSSKKLAESATGKDAKAVIDKWLKVNKDETIDKVKIAVGITAIVLGLASSVVSLATTPFTGGMGGIAGIIGVMRSVARLAGVLHDYAKDVDTLLNALEKDLKSLANDFRNNIKKAKAADLVKEAFNGVVFPANVLKTVNTVEQQLTIVQRKLRMIEVDTHKLAKEINKGLTACDKGGKELDRILKEIGGNKDLQAPLMKAAAALEKSQKELMDAITGVSSNQVAVEQRVAQTEKLAKIMEEVSEKRGLLLKLVEQWITIGARLTDTALAGGFKEAADATITSFAGVKAVEAIANGPLKGVL